MTPTQRTMAECKKRGFIVQIVERWNQWARVRQDLFGCIDIVAITPNGIVGIQATGGSGNHAHRRVKALAEPRLQAWLKAGGKFEIWSWNKRGPRNKAKRWTLREEAVTL